MLVKAKGEAYEGSIHIFPTLRRRAAYREEGHGYGADENVGDGQRGDEVVCRLPNLTVNLQNFCYVDSNYFL